MTTINESEYLSYLNRQQQVRNNVRDISNNIYEIKQMYSQMDGTADPTKNQKYDFTDDKEVYVLKEDRTIIPALLKDKQTLLTEHNNLYIVTTLTIATLLMTAIFMSS